MKNFVVSYLVLIWDPLSWEYDQDNNRYRSHLMADKSNRSGSKCGRGSSTNIPQDIFDYSHLHTAQYCNRLGT